MSHTNTLLSLSRIKPASILLLQSRTGPSKLARLPSQKGGLVESRPARMDSLLFSSLLSKGRMGSGQVVVHCAHPQTSSSLSLRGQCGLVLTCAQLSHPPDPGAPRRASPDRAPPTNGPSKQARLPSRKGGLVESRAARIADIFSPLSLRAVRPGP